MAESRRRIQGIESGLTLQQLFMKTLQKMIKYRSEKQTIEEKLKHLQVSCILSISNRVPLRCSTTWEKRDRVNRRSGATSRTRGAKAT